MKQIESRADIEFLVNGFYAKVRADEVIGFFFNEIAKTDWDHHLPKMYDFWDTILFGKRSYKGNPLAAHIPVNFQVPMETFHFEHWVSLWTQTVRENFDGEVADLAIYKAQNIAEIMSFRLEDALRYDR